MTHRPCLTLLVLLLLGGCDAAPAPKAAGSGPRSDAAPAAAPEAAAGEPVEVEADDSTLLRRPFTAEQIRDEWIVGLTLVMKTDSFKAGALERWTVVAADAEGAEIQLQQIDDAGDPAGEPRVSRSTWVELRDHANFPAASATREDVTRDTALGPLDGWLYRVSDSAAGTVSDLFFARSLPGAPVQMRVLKDGETVMEMAQIERSRPAAP